jgi:hypothetical protein
MTGHGLKCKGLRAITPTQQRFEELFVSAKIQSSVTTLHSKHGF